MDTRKIHTKVAGVTFEGRQEWIQSAFVNQPVMIAPEPTNKYDPNALAVYLASNDPDGAKHVGYIPKEIAAEIAPAIEGERVIGRVFEVTGGFEKWDGTHATYGLIIEIEIPDDVLRAD
jgi:hypothetical protein